MSEDAPFDHKNFLKSLTHRPGIYRMLNATGKVIYVGKALDLRKRVSSYFSRKPTDAKTASMMQVVGPFAERRRTGFPKKLSSSLPKPE